MSFGAWVTPSRIRFDSWFRASGRVSVQKWRVFSIWHYWNWFLAKTLSRLLQNFFISISNRRSWSIFLIIHVQIWDLKIWYKSVTHIQVSKRHSRADWPLLTKRALIVQKVFRPIFGSKRQISKRLPIRGLKNLFAEKKAFPC